MKIAKTLTCCFYILFFAALVAFDPAGFGTRRASAQSNTGAPQGVCSWPLQIPGQKGLALPSQMGATPFETLLNAYTSNGCYKTDPRWKQDLEIRDTGAYLGGKYYGTHNAVKVYYSPEIVKWLGSGKDSDRKEGDIPDGAAIIKEMYTPPAKQDPNQTVNGLAIMVKDKNGSYDGWFWSDGSPTINYGMYPNAGFALYCVNCHASAKTELTFSTINNILGNSITFNPTMPPNMINVPPAGRTGVSQPRAQIGAPRQLSDEEDISVHLKRDAKTDTGAIRLPTAPAHRASGAPSALPTPKQMVIEWYDTATQQPQSQKPQMFITSNQCIGCHDATQNNPAMPNMIYQQIYNKIPPSPSPTPTSELDLNLSPYSEWRSSMMGLAGRDPVFFSQLETEMNLYPGIKDQIVNTCLSCHGIMGQRQLALDTGKPYGFKLEYLDQKPDQTPAQPFAEYGALARDGISCAVCHHISDEGLGTPATYTGKFKTGKADEIFGPFQDVATVPMKNSLGLTPLKTKANQIHKSALCGSCHTVILPVLTPGKPYTPGENVFTNPNQRTEHEQNTYLEWRNSKFQDEFPPVNRETAQSCQQCHMPGQYPSKTGEQVKFKIASIEDETFPAVEFRARDEDIHLRVRGTGDEGTYSRHTLVGLNLFVMEIFNQFSDPLGISSVNYSNKPAPFFDPMATWGNPVPSMVVTKKSALQMARSETAQVEIASLKRTAKGLSAQVKVTNLAGHRFPSGVSFRRAFIEFRVNVGGKPYWVSGATNEKGVIGIWDGARFTPLITESFAKSKNPQQLFQPHYDVITKEDQVQIYEELMKDANGNFTTSFLSLANQVKDNRMMPQGWRENGPDAEHTAPGGVPRASNPGYFDGSGTDVVTYEVPLDARITAPVTVSATIYYQTIPPYYLEQRYANSPDGPFTNSLRYYVANLNTNYIDPRWRLFLNEAPIKDWKLLVVGTPHQTLR
ncbi:MAG TPA: hypothetical protein VJ842_19805 [Pyrinomonadaceae bacterium]|nr:hypothetical protein [Pyrinomonadaceae bacterium]